MFFLLTRNCSIGWLFPSNTNAFSIFSFIMELFPQMLQTSNTINIIEIPKTRTYKYMSQLKFMFIRLVQRPQHPKMYTYIHARNLSLASWLSSLEMERVAWVQIVDEAVCVLRFYCYHITKYGTIVNSVSWLPHAFAVSLFINSLCAHVVFERSTYGEWNNLSESSSDGWLGAGHSKKRKTIPQQFTIIYWNVLV